MVDRIAVAPKLIQQMGMPKCGLPDILCSGANMRPRSVPGGPNIVSVRLARALDEWQARSCGLIGLGISSRATRFKELRAQRGSTFMSEAFLYTGSSYAILATMPSPDASHIACLLKEFGRRVMLYGGNPHRAKAYLRAADSVALLTEPIGDLIAQNRLREIPGVGEAIAGVITTLFQTGSHPSLEKMRADVPDSVLEMLTIPGLRPEKVLKLHKELGIDTIDELRPLPSKTG